MKILKAIGLLLLGLILGFLLLSAFSRKEFKTSQSTIIDAPQSLVFNTVNDLSTWDSWSPWVEMDPTSVTTLGDPFIGTGGYYTWSGEEIGTGKMEIKQSTSPQEIKTAINFDERGNAEATFNFEPASAGTKVTWSFYSKASFPTNGFMVLMGMEKSMDKSYARGLELLKAKVETIAARKPKLAVKEIQYPGQTYLIHREKIGMDEITNFYDKNLPAVFGLAQQHKLKMNGMPCGLFFSWDVESNQTDIAAAIPVTLTGKLPKGVKQFSTKKGKALQVDYYGEYAGTVAAHNAIEAHLKANGQEMVWPCIESYVTDPTTEPNPKKWLTQVIYPLQ